MVKPPSSLSGSDTFAAHSAGHVNEKASIVNILVDYYAITSARATESWLM